MREQRGGDGTAQSPTARATEGAVEGASGRAALVALAAGASRRMGCDKLLVDLGGQPLLAYGLNAAAASGFDTLAVILSQPATALPSNLASLLDELRVEREQRRLAGPLLLENTQSQEGKAASVRLAVAHLRRSHQAIGFLPGDQPFITVSLLNELLEKWRRHRGIVRPVSDERPGSPVLFDQEFFDDLARLRGDTGGREVIRLHPDAVHQVKVADSRVLHDVDDPASLAAARAVLAAKAAHRDRWRQAPALGSPD